MQSLKKRSKLGFTLTELAIVIAVIAILIAVLVPTFISLINKANESADQQNVKNMNTTLSLEEIDNNKPEYLCEVWAILTEAGYSYTPAYTANTFYWYKDVNRIIIAQGDEVTYPSEYEDYTIVDDSQSSGAVENVELCTIAITASGTTTKEIKKSELYDMNMDEDSDDAHEYDADGVCTICNHSKPVEKNTDQLTVDTMNAAIAAEYTEIPDCLCEILTTLEQYGYSSYTANLTGNSFSWYKKENCIVIVNNNSVTYPSEYKSITYYSSNPDFLALESEKTTDGVHNFNEYGLCKICGTSGGTVSEEYRTDASYFTYYIVNEDEKTCGILYYTAPTQNASSVIYFPSTAKLSDSGTTRTYNANGTEYTVTQIGDIQFGYNGYSVFCGIDTDLTLDNTVTTIIIPNSVDTVYAGAFMGCTALTTVNIPDSVTSNIAMTFALCANLKTIHIPYQVEQIMTMSFMGCYSLEKITFGDCHNISKLTDIDENAFINCPSLKQIVIPSSADVDESAFSYGSEYDTEYYEYLKAFGLDEQYCGITKIDAIYYLGAYDIYENLGTIISANDSGTATVYYYSITQPTDTEHSYWHYINGVPTAW